MSTMRPGVSVCLVIFTPHVFGSKPSKGLLSLGPYSTAFQANPAQPPLLGMRPWRTLRSRLFLNSRPHPSSMITCARPLLNLTCFDGSTIHHHHALHAVSTHDSRAKGCWTTALSVCNVTKGSKCKQLMHTCNASASRQSQKTWTCNTSHHQAGRARLEGWCVVRGRGLRDPVIEA